MPKVGQSNAVRCIAKVTGMVLRAKGLLNSKLIGKSRPRCLIKGIRGNSHLVDIHTTKLESGQDPEWNEKFSFDAMKERTHDEFVGLKFICYDGQDFMGGADVDISELPEHREVEEELELTGMIFLNQKKGQAPKKARLFVTITVERRVVYSLERPQAMLSTSLRSVARTTCICGRIVRARGIRPRSEAMLFVRCYMLSGKIVDVFNTHCENPETVDPHWNQTFSFDFDDETDQPLMLMFNIFAAADLGTSNPRLIFKADDHLGSCMTPVDGIKDEQAFLKGEGRIKLRLLDECQQIEKRIGRDAGRAARESQAAEDGLTVKKMTWADRLDARFGNLVDKMSTPSLGSDKNYVTLELFAERQEQLMPHYELMHESRIVEEEEAEEDPELREYFAEQKQKKVVNPNELIKRLEILSEDRIFTVYGRIICAMDLIAADITGKSDPYVIVEALTKYGEVLFVYRTRYIKACLNPIWNEGFFWNVPADPDNPKVPVPLSKLLFSIYDTDEGQLLESSEDDFLGSCTQDIQFMRNQDCLCEDIPLLGVKIRGGPKPKSGSFRRFSTLSAEVRVERRVVRIVHPKMDYDPSLLDMHRHHESREMRPPDVMVYRDWSQEDAKTDVGVNDATAVKVLDLQENNKLLELAKTNARFYKQREDQGWLHVRELESKHGAAISLESKKSGALTDATKTGEGVQETEPYRRNYKVLNQNWTDKMGQSQKDLRNIDYVNRLPPMKRTGSVPIMGYNMATRFGDRYRQLANTFNPFEEDWFSPHNPNRITAETQHFVSQSGMLDTVMDNMRTKPNFEHYAMRRDVSTAPAKISTVL